MNIDMILGLDLIHQVYNMSDVSLVGKKFVTVNVPDSRPYYTEKTEYTVRNVNETYNTLVITCNCNYDQSLGDNVDLLKADCIFLKKFIGSHLIELK